MDTDPTFLGEPPASEATARLYEEDVSSDGYVGNLTRLWAWRPEVLESFTALRGALSSASTLASRELAVLVAATAAARGDAYCALAWGARLAAESDDATAAGVLAGGSPASLSAREVALADWARAVVGDPNATSVADVDGLRAAGLSDREIFEATVFVAFRLAFSTVNDALGAVPDRQLVAEAPEAVRRAVSFGRRTPGSD
jgi:uncharacterized peroxidase-related enzyme